MKKRLEAELISIAHRILKLKSKSELDQLYVESRKLYETLSVLKFVEDNIHAIQPVIAESDIEKMIKNSEDKTDQKIVVASDQKIEVEAQHESNLEEELLIIDTAAEEDLSIEKQNLDVESDIVTEEIEEIVDEKIVVPVEIETEKPILLFEPSMDYSAEFVKKDTAEKDAILFDKKAEITFEKAESPQKQQISFDELLAKPSEELHFKKNAQNTKQTTLNDALGKNATFGLNDKIGFVKNLFDGSEEDFNRVVSQTGTLRDADEIKNFIEELIKPDYNNWENKENYETRFMEIILSRFS